MGQCPHQMTKILGLRKYERERRRYYFAVIECDNKFTAQSIYELTDGTEFMVST